MSGVSVLRVWSHDSHMIQGLKGDTVDDGRRGKQGDAGDEGRPGPRGFKGHLGRQVCLWGVFQRGGELSLPPPLFI